MIKPQMALAKSLNILLAKANALNLLNPLAKANGNEYKSYLVQFAIQPINLNAVSYLMKLIMYICTQEKNNLKLKDNMAKSKHKDLKKIQAGQRIQHIDERRFIECSERMYHDKNNHFGNPIFVLATAVKAKKKVQQVLPPPNIKLNETTASPLNIYTANVAYTYKSRPFFFTFMDNVWAKLRGNISYPDLPVSNDDWDVEKKLYDKAKADKKTDSSDQHYSNLIYMSKLNGVNVANGCGNDLEVFNSSGYVANKTTKAASKNMGKVEILSCKDTKNSGEATITMKAMPGVQYYLGCWCLASDKDRKMTQCKGSKGIKMTFKKLPVDVPILLFAWAVGPLDEGDLSDGKPWQPR
jgi:hypothetical protein